MAVDKFKKIAALPAAKLRVFAAKQGIAGASRMRKSEILSKIKSLAKRDAWGDGSWNQSVIGNSGYSATDPRRKILMRGHRPTRATANELAMASLYQLRNYCRSLDRNNPQARAAVDGLVALVVGTGIALEPDCGSESTNEKIRKEWIRYIESVTVDDRNIDDLLTQGFRETVTAGELLWRFVVIEDRSKENKIPLCILPLEAEWLDDVTSGSIVYLPGPNGTVQVGCITMDKYGRPITYRIRNPEYNSLWPSEELPASALVHVFEKRRSMQIRGEPWMVPTIETLYQDRDLVDAELQAAITASSIGIAITSQAHDPLDTGDGSTGDESVGTEDDPAQALRIGSVARLFPGEDIKAFAHDRPGQQIMPFRQGLRGDIAACMRLSQRFLDRDTSRANYSSMRADMLDTERLLGPVREWYGHGTIGRIYREVLPYLCIRAGVPVPENKGYRLIPDSQPYVDPQKDVLAAKDAIRSGLSTWEAEIGKRGGDSRKLLQQLKNELSDPFMAMLFEGMNDQQSAQGGEDKTVTEEAADKKDEPVKDTDATDDEERTEDIKTRESEQGKSLSADDIAMITRSVIDAMRVSPQPQPHITVNNNMPEGMIGGSTINVATPEVRNDITVETPTINVEAQDPTPIEVHVDAPVVHVAAAEPAAAPQIQVNVAAPEVTVENTVEVPSRTIIARPDGKGNVIMTPQE